MKLRLIGVVHAAIAGATLTAPVVAQEAFVARVTTVPISLAEATAITGLGAARGRLDGRTLVIDGRFDGLQGAATRAELHIGSVRGVRGEAFAEIDVEPRKAGTFTGSTELQRAQVAALREGRMYLQIHSVAAPDGNLWGWLLPVEEGP